LYITEFNRPQKLDYAYIDRKTVHTYSTVQKAQAKLHKDD